MNPQGHTRKQAANNFATQSHPIQAKDPAKTGHSPPERKDKSPQKRLTQASMMRNATALAALMAPLCIANAKALALDCYEAATARYNRARVSIDAPYNYARAIHKGKPPYNCNIKSHYVTEYSLRIICQDGYQYEIGVNMGRGEKYDSIVTLPNGQRAYIQSQAAGEAKLCMPGGARLVIYTKVYPQGKEILIISEHHFRK
jgi:hypothetical protein